MMKFLSDKIRQGAADEIELLIVSVTRHHHKQLGSPIEALMFEAIVASQFCKTGKLPKIVLEGAGPGEGDWKITPQAQIGKYRIDFLIEDEGTGVTVALECDGHDFHERTKEQAQKDRNRDRDLQAKGYLVLRYTGSEIWRDPWGCAMDIEHKMYCKLFADGEKTS